MSITSEFLRHPLLTGAIAPSSPWLAETMTAGLGLERAARVAELGPGTGVFTEAVLALLRPEARLTAVEINPRFAASLSERFPQVDVVTGSAEHLALDNVDVVVSGLPWTAMTAVRQQRILDAVTAALASNGRFTTFAYAHAAWTPPARRFAASLRSRFAVVERTPVVWGNLPPAFVYRAALPVTVGRTRRGQSAATSA
ncbi:methyltransferase domain-containing protein [Amycolatopsis balhimycina DSM 5908]|uniref:Methyltransferase domain-containing protein n=1 Tax=Amycolatopsis balhimycina DSM 5908 TaxID=1081091 RepID=A0A428WG44_AMYBA|nr:methyltransferase domain-containing protein [Amycolatopsis balhimycina]RSM42022.1 methyltransferase domain-containing protein [Amycolatopsis balhimycina DSM 5908]